MNSLKSIFPGFFISIIAINYMNEEKNSSLKAQVFETSSEGNKLTKLSDFKEADKKVVIKLNTENTFLQITGFGVAFTESSAYLLNQISKKNRDTILGNYFSEEGKFFYSGKSFTAIVLPKNIIN